MLKRTSDIDNMYHRYLGYRAGKEPLSTMANFCLTVLESMVGRARKRTEKRQIAVEKFSVAVDVLNSEAGGPAARKQVDIDQHYAPENKKFLRAAIQHMIFRAAEVANGLKTERKQITLDTIKSNGIWAQESQGGTPLRIQSAPPTPVKSRQKRRKNAVRGA